MYSEECFIPIDYGEVDIKTIINNAKYINSTNSKFILFNELVDYKFNLIEGATDKEILELKDEYYPYKIPDDYIEFLEQSNGIELFHASGKLYDAKSAYLSHDGFGFFDNIMVIGSIFADVYFCMDLSARDKNNMYLCEIISMGNMYSLNCSFKEFLGRFISSYGLSFWMWGVDYSKYIRVNDLD